LEKLAYELKKRVFPFEGLLLAICHCDIDNEPRAVLATSPFGARYKVNGHDKYTRTIGVVILPDGTNLKQELVKQGWCWWYRKYAPVDTALEGLETEAREAQKDLWADP
jgi:endonuclease YncB( thermonuclease family)